MPFNSFGVIRKDDDSYEYRPVRSELLGRTARVMNTI